MRSGSSPSPSLALGWGWAYKGLMNNREAPPPCGSGNPRGFRSFVPGTGKRREYLAGYSPMPPKGIASGFCCPRVKLRVTGTVLEVLFCVW